MAKKRKKEKKGKAETAKPASMPKPSKKK